MRESRTSGSVGRAPGNRGLYPELFMISVTNLHFSEIEGSACYIAVGLEFK